MSYMTTYNLDWTREHPPTQDELLDYIILLKDHLSPGDPGYDNSLSYMTRILFDGEEDPWYDCHEHLTLASLRWPDATFTLNAQGEEHDDTWRAFYHNGRCAIIKAIKVYPDFNPERLKGPRPDLHSPLTEKLQALQHQVQETSIPTPAPRRPGVTPLPLPLRPRPGPPRNRLHRPGQHRHHRRRRRRPEPRNLRPLPPQRHVLHPPGRQDHHRLPAKPGGPRNRPTGPRLSQGHKRCRPRRLTPDPAFPNLRPTGCPHERKPAHQDRITPVSHHRSPSSPGPRRRYPGPGLHLEDPGQAQLAGKRASHAPTPSCTSSCPTSGPTPSTCSTTVSRTAPCP